MATMRDVQKALDMPTGEFRKEWLALSDKDKDDLKEWAEDEAQA